MKNKFAKNAKLWSILLIALLLPTASMGQASKGPAREGAVKPSDVASIDAILHGTYACISGPAGQQRNWERFRALFIPGARLIVAAPNPAGGLVTHVRSVDEYIAAASPFFEKSGFFEREIARHSDRFGNVAQIFSTYESLHRADDARPFARGINSFQLFNDGRRWWIVTIYWQAETAENPIPSLYLK